MKPRQESNCHHSELQTNWVGKGNLNAGESDLMYKYHVVSIVNESSCCADCHTITAVSV